jgi:hypothetical protein
LRNLSVDDPSDPPRSVEGVILPATVRRSVGVEVPIPTLPFASTVKRDAPVDDATTNGLVVDVP